MSISLTHKIGAAKSVEASQIAMRMFDNVNERTLDPTKHPPGGAEAHSNDNPCNFNLGRSLAFRCDLMSRKG